MLSTEFDIDCRGIKLAIADSGQGQQTLLLLHGGGDNLATWNALGPLLAPDFRLIAWDARGHGRSQTPNDVALEDFLHEIDAVLDAFGLRRAVLVGHSWGGATALRYAASNRSRCDAIVAIDPGLWKGGTDLPPFDQALIDTRGYAWTGTEEEFEEKVASWLARSAVEYPEEPLQVVETTFRRSFEKDLDGLWRRKPTVDYMLQFGPLVRASASRLSIDLLARLRCPALLICARDGGVIGAAAPLVDGLGSRSNVSVTWLSGGHFLHWTDAGEVAALIRQAVHSSGTDSISALRPWSA